MLGSIISVPATAKSGYMIKALGGAMMNKSISERFWSKVEKQDNGCWIWTRSKLKSGYGMFGLFPNKPTLAHRMAWELTNGKIPDGRKVLHKCDNPPCVNPDHLFLGTQYDNIHDMMNKGRAKKPPSPSGYKNPRAKLTEADVYEIQKLISDGVERDVVLTKFSIGETTYYEILNKKHWVYK